MLLSNYNVCELQERTSERVSVASLKNGEAHHARNVCMHACVSVNVCVYVCARVCAFLLCLGVCMCAHTMCVCVRVHVNVRVRACEYLRVSVLVCECACVCLCCPTVAAVVFMTLCSLGCLKSASTHSERQAPAPCAPCPTSSPSQHELRFLRVPSKQNLARHAHLTKLKLYSPSKLVVLDSACMVNRELCS